MNSLNTGMISHVWKDQISITTNGSYPFFYTQDY